MASDMKASIHRFRLRRVSPSPREADRARSASPPPSPDQRLHMAARHETTPSASTGARSSGGRPQVPACDRCRSFKKKCSRTFPICALCASAGQRCSYANPVAGAEAQAHQLRVRVQWLSRYIDDNLLVSRQQGGIDAVETGADLTSVLGRGQSDGCVDGAARLAVSSITGSSSLSKTPGSTTPPLELTSARDATVTSASVAGHEQQLEQRNADARLDERDPGSVGDSSHLSYQASGQSSVKRRLITTQSLPPDIPPSRFVDAFFRHVNRAYPFVDQAKIRRDLEIVGSSSPVDQDPPMTLLYLVMAIGCTTLVRAGQVPSDTARRFDVVYSDVIQECLCNEGVESVQILVLLGLYSLFDPTATSAYSIVGIAARHAMVIGLTRPGDETGTPVEAELRHRLYWSVFVLDRMMAGSQGLPVALTDENASVPLPGLTVEEFASSERAVYARNLQTSRHVIQLRQLEGRILQAVHLGRKADLVGLTPVDRRAMLSTIRSDIEDWYSSGCLMSPMEADNLPIHSSITWLSAQYYHLLVLLYFPNHLNSSAAAVTRQELLEFARKQLQANSVLLQQRQLPLNRVTLCRLLPVCLVLMHDFVATCNANGWTHQSGVSFAARDEIAFLITILEAFPKGWTVAHEAARIIQHFASIIATDGGMATYLSNQTMFSPPGREDTGALVKSCIASFTGLVNGYLGRATCFQAIVYMPEPKAEQDSESLATQQQQQQQQGTTNNPLWLNGVRTEAGGLSEETVMGYGWSSWDLDFL